MKLFVICSLLFALALADLRPIYEFEEWWAVRAFKPSPLMQSRFRGSRIVGGNEAGPQQFPYQAGLRLTIPGNANQGTCGASLVSTTRVITAAHCIDIVSSADVHLGAHFLNREEATQVRQTIPATNIFWHEDYNRATIVNDVAIMNLNSAVTETPAIRPIRLPRGADVDNDFAGELAVASGWGRHSSANVASEFLRFVQVNVMTNTACRVRFPTLIQQSTICTAGTGGVGACNGDSGGPLTVQVQGESVMIGIASFAFTSNCEAGWPTGFARVTSFVSWFNARM